MAAIECLHGVLLVSWCEDCSELLSRQLLADQALPEESRD